MKTEQLDALEAVAREALEPFAKMAERNSTYPPEHDPVILENWRDRSGPSHEGCSHGRSVDVSATVPAYGHPYLYLRALARASRRGLCVSQFPRTPPRQAREGHPAMTPEQLDALEAVARAATPGPWFAAPEGAPGPQWWMVLSGSDAVASYSTARDARHTATFDPPQALALIAEVRRLQGELLEIGNLANDGRRTANLPVIARKAYHAVKSDGPRGVGGEG